MVIDNSIGLGFLTGYESKVRNCALINRGFVEQNTTFKNLEIVIYFRMNFSCNIKSHNGMVTFKPLCIANQLL